MITIFKTFVLQPRNCKKKYTNQNSKTLLYQNVLKIKKISEAQLSKRDFVPITGRGILKSSSDFIKLGKFESETLHLKMFNGSPYKTRYFIAKVSFFRKQKLDIRFGSYNGIKHTILDTMWHPTAVTPFMGAGFRFANKLNIFELYCDPFRQIHWSIKFFDPSISPISFLGIAINGINDTLSVSRLVFSRLYFCIIPRFLILSTNVLSHKERMKDLIFPFTEKDHIETKRQNLEITMKNLPLASDRKDNLDEKLLVCSKN